MPSHAAVGGRLSAPHRRGSSSLTCPTESPRSQDAPFDEANLCPCHLAGRAGGADQTGFQAGLCRPPGVRASRAPTRRGRWASGRTEDPLSDLARALFSREPPRSAPGGAGCRAVPANRDRRRAHRWTAGATAAGPARPRGGLPLREAPQRVSPLARVDERRRGGRRLAPLARVLRAETCRRHRSGRSGVRAGRALAERAKAGRTVSRRAAAASWPIPRARPS